MDWICYNRCWHPYPMTCLQILAVFASGNVKLLQKFYIILHLLIILVRKLAHDGSVGVLAIVAHGCGRGRRRCFPDWQGRSPLLRGGSRITKSAPHLQPHRSLRRPPRFETRQLMWPQNFHIAMVHLIIFQLLFYVF